MSMKFERNKLSFDSGACIESMKQTMSAYMNMLSDQFIEIMRKQIDINSLASKRMKSDAKSAVREVSREITNEFIEAKVGFDESYARGLAVDFYVRTMVVMFGNQAGGPITTKPGQSTWKKHVTNYSESTAKTEYAIPQFDQPGFANKILENTIKQIEKYMKDMLRSMSQVFNGSFYGAFLRGG